MNTSITSQPTDRISLGTLMSEVSGPALTPTDEGYATELGGFNLIAAPAADLVVGATNAHDVTLAVRYARANGFRVGPGPPDTACRSRVGAPSSSPPRG